MHDEAAMRYPWLMVSFEWTVERLIALTVLEIELYPKFGVGLEAHRRVNAEVDTEGSNCSCDGEPIWDTVSAHFPRRCAHKVLP